MSEETEDTFEPRLLGEIDDGPFGKVPFYAAYSTSEVDDIYTYRQDNGQSESGGIVDEFFFMAPSGAFGTEGISIEFTSNNVKKSGAIFNAPKVNEEPIIMFKAYYHYAGDFIEPVLAKDIDIKSSIEEHTSATFTLPKIPWEMVDKMDQFFRAVDDKYNSEGIVLLTYDFNFRYEDSPEMGWGFAVPDQKNNSVHCDYDKTSVMESLADNIQIVGTVHSHPHMPAYASETDHNDQAGFDGVHITYGWHGKTNNQTEYHVELVRGNNFYWLEPSTVLDLDAGDAYEFTDANGEIHRIPPGSIRKVRIEADMAKGELDGHLDKVTASVTTSSSNYYGTQPGHHNRGGQGKAPAPTPMGAGQHKFTDHANFFPRNSLPEDILEFNFGMKMPLENVPDPRYNNVFLRTHVVCKRCPVCQTNWDKSFYNHNNEMTNRRQCLGCGIFVLEADETIADMAAVRTDAGYVDVGDVIDDDLPNVIWNIRDEGDVDWEIGDTFENQLGKVDSPKASAQ